MSQNHKKKKHLQIYSYSVLSCQQSIQSLLENLWTDSIPPSGYQQQMILQIFQLFDQC